MFLVQNFKNVNWEHVEFDEGMSQFLLFLVVYHILSEMEIWPFLRLLRMNIYHVNQKKNCSRIADVLDLDNITEP